LYWQALFFDFDGVLVDSLDVKARAFARIFEPFGPEIVGQVVDHHHQYGGMTRVDKFCHYYAEFLHQPLDPADLKELCQRFSELVVDEVVAAPEIPGASAFVQAHCEKMPCFIVSAAPEAELMVIVKKRGYDKYFREVRGAPASKRQNLELLFRRYAYAPERCWFFGDAESDYRAAESIGVNFLGILPGPEAPLLRVKPDIQWRRNFTEIFSFLET
jgi:phosphoglycolate phosphatase-like HAD superfamily hydrolase